MKELSKAKKLEKENKKYNKLLKEFEKTPTKTNAKRLNKQNKKIQKIAFEYK
jgi:hypothetical protein